VRLSDLLGKHVVDASGRRRVVTDVRVVQDGRLLGTFGAALRVDGLVLNHRMFGAHLGIDRANVRGPAIVKAILARLQRDPRYLTWDRIHSIEEDRVRIHGSLSELPPAGRSR
jgi:hypothetical protein